MANYGGLSYGNQAICGTNIEPHLNGSREITGITCFQIHNSASAKASILINGQTVEVGGASTLDMVIHSIGTLTTDECLICSCHDCNNPDGSAARAVSWPMTGATGAAGAPTLLNPSSPYTLIGMGYLNS